MAKGSELAFLDIDSSVRKFATEDEIGVLSFVSPVTLIYGLVFIVLSVVALFGNASRVLLFYGTWGFGLSFVIFGLWSGGMVLERRARIKKGIFSSSEARDEYYRRALYHARTKIEEWFAEKVKPLYSRLEQIEQAIAALEKSRDEIDSGSYTAERKQAILASIQSDITALCDERAHVRRVIDDCGEIWNPVRQELAVILATERTLFASPLLRSISGKAILTPIDIFASFDRIRTALEDLAKHTGSELRLTEERIADGVEAARLVAKSSIQLLQNQTIGS